MPKFRNKDRDGKKFIKRKSENDSITSDDMKKKKEDNDDSYVLPRKWTAKINYEDQPEAIGTLTALKETINALESSKKNKVIVSLETMIKTMTEKYSNVNPNWGHYELGFDLLVRYIRSDKRSIKVTAIKAMQLYLLSAGQLGVEKWADDVLEVILPYNQSKDMDVKENAINLTACIYYMQRSQHVEFMSWIISLMAKSPLSNISESTLKTSEESFYMICFYAWAVLYTNLRVSNLQEVTDTSVNWMVKQLKNPNPWINLAAGYCLAVIYERMIGEVSDSYQIENYQEIIQQIEKYTRTNPRNDSTQQQNQARYRQILFSFKKKFTQSNLHEKIEMQDSEYYIDNWTMLVTYKYFQITYKKFLDDQIIPNSYFRYVFTDVLNQEKSFDERVEQKSGFHSKMSIHNQFPETDDE